MIVKILKLAKQSCNHLFVCLSSDEQIKYLKGYKRPINNIDDRLHMLIHMNFIDYIILYNEVNDNNESVLDNIMNIIKPETWFKGTDYKKEDILQKHPSLKNIALIELEENKSTTICFPKNKPSKIPSGTGANKLDNDKPSKFTPAFAKANIGIIINAT